MTVSIMNGPGMKTIILIENDAVYFETPLKDERLRLAGIKVIIRGCEIHVSETADEGDKNATD